MKTTATTFLLVIIFLFSAYGQNNAQAQNGYWVMSSPSKLKGQALQNKKVPNDYKLFTLNFTSLREALKNTPSEESVSKLKSGQTILLPNSDGQLKAFRVVEAPVMEPGLSAKYPEIKSYAASNIEDPSVTARFDISPEGFHGIIFSEKGSDYIDPLIGDDYMVYSKSAMGANDEHFECLLTLNHGEVKTTSALKSADDGTLRKFRLALACTGEYSQHFLNGTETTDAQRKAKVLAAMNTTMTRVNGVFEKDFCLRLVIITNNDAIIYLNASTDPWTSEYNTKTQSTIDAVIGSANYDIGHLVVKGSDNGNAGCIGCVCTSGSKGSGFTSHTNPLGDPFDIDYVAHEMGHQLGANHTFTFNNEGTIAQMEPGSGSSIMGYAGITGSTDVQAHSDDYFHAISIQQVTGFIKSASCVQASATGNSTPTASAGSDYTIPKSTPFELTGNGSDADASDALTFCWEQIDNRTSTSSTMPSATATSGPVFRSYKPVASKTRVFPNLATILSGSTANTWEAIPSVARTLNFRLTVRDNHTGGGSNQYDDMKVTVSSASGPFAITAPNTAVAWNGSTTQTITWNVASTTASPVSCSAVNILLSTDGGQTFPNILASNVANDGSENIVVPNTPGTQCRIKIKAANNIFFDISNADFTIAAGDTTPVSVTGVSLSSPTLALTTGQTSTLVATVSPSNATNKTVSWSSDNTSVATVNTSGTVTAVAPGTANITVTTQDGNKTALCQVTVTIPSCDAPTGLAASNISNTSFTLTWNAVAGATSYDVSIGGTVTTTTSTSLNASGLLAGTAYSVMVRTNCASGTSAYSTAITVTTTNSLVYCTASGGVTYEWIAQVQLGTINNITGANGGYGNFTSLSASLVSGASHTIYFKAGFRSSTYKENWKAWIDYNKDGDFADSGEEIASGSSTGTTLINASFTVPATAALGATRLRVEMRYGATPASCGTFTYGEVEDYTVNITASAGREISYPVVENSVPMNKELSMPEFGLYPNPAEDKLMINLPDANSISSVKVFDISGKELQLPVNTQNNSLNVAKLAKGLYIVVIETDRGEFQKSFVKQ